MTDGVPNSHAGIKWVDRISPPENPGELGPNARVPVKTEVKTENNDVVLIFSEASYRIEFSPEEAESLAEMILSSARLLLAVKKYSALAVAGMELQKAVLSDVLSVLETIWHKGKP